MCGRDGKIELCKIVVGLGTAFSPEQTGATGLLLLKTLQVVGSIRTGFHRVVPDIALTGLLKANADVDQLLGLVKLVLVVSSLITIISVPFNTDFSFQ